MSNLTLEQYRSAVLDELDRLEFQQVFDKVEELTGSYATELTSITTELIDRYFEIGANPKEVADELYTAAVMAFAEIFGNLTKN
jgi:hypothetical protein